MIHFTCFRSTTDIRVTVCWNLPPQVMPQTFSYNNYVSFVTLRMYVPVLMLCKLIYYMITVTWTLSVSRWIFGNDGCTKKLCSQC